tara:strand:- start:197 stop:1117 length:921 start_codon:yes stop_codon:yes gene_type:complete
MGIKLMAKNIKRSWRYHTIKELLIKDFNKMIKKSHTRPDHHRMHIFRRSFADQVDDLVSAVCDGSYLPSYRERMIFEDETVDYISYQDRLAQKAILHIIRPSYDYIIPPTCYHRYGPSGVKKALAHLRHAMDTHVYSDIIRLDIKSYYASIDHRILMGLLKQAFNDPRLINMFTAFITSYILTNKGFINPHKGISIRSSLSTFFGAIYLKPLDIAFANMDLCYIRYMDDVLILCKSYSQYKRAKQRIDTVLNSLRLELSPKKTYMGLISDFHFLGCHIDVLPAIDAPLQPGKHLNYSQRLHPRSLD